MASKARLAATGVVIAVAAVLAGVPRRRWLLGKLPIAWLVVGVAVLSLISGMPMAEIRLAPVVTFAARCYLAFLAFSALSSTTHNTDTIRALESLKVPAILTMIAGSIFRWFELVQSEAISANNARLLRGGGEKGKLGQLRDVVRLSSALMARSYDRAERAATAMECRGFHGKLMRVPCGPLRYTDIAPVFVLVLCMASIRLFIP